MNPYKNDTDFETMIDVKAAIQKPFSGAAWLAFRFRAERFDQLLPKELRRMVNDVLR